MEHVIVVLAATKGPFAAAIKAVTYSQWSHVALVMPDGSVREAVLQDGIRSASFESLISRSSKYVLLKVPVKNAAEVYAKALDVNAGYDILGAIGLGVGRNWQENDRFWCSEYLAYVLEVTGNGVFRPEAMHRITPEHFWMLPLEVVGGSV